MFLYLAKSKESCTWRAISGLHPWQGAKLINPPKFMIIVNASNNLARIIHARDDAQNTLTDEVPILT